MNAATLVQKLWNYCNVLRDDGMSYGDYVEQLTYLLFLKMANERSRPPYNQPSLIPAQYAWPVMFGKDGDERFHAIGVRRRQLRRWSVPRCCSVIRTRAGASWTECPL
jgi:hypothetical protein